MRAVVLFGLALLLTACNAGPKVVIQEQEDTTSAPKATPVANWEYKTDRTSSWACARSADNAAELCFRKERGHLDSYLHLPFREGNPFFCQRGRCPTKLRMDAGPEQTLQGTDDDDGGTRILFLPDPQKLLHDVQEAKELHVSPPMFGVDQQFVFQVAGLTWK
jgi:hypothetical protein